jgi:uncharacterized protein (DUF1697 family)
MRHVAFLRAINVGGRSIVRMTDVAAAFTAAGCEDVRTVIASGNVLFDAPAAGAPLRARIGAGMATLLGTPPTIVFRTLPDLQRMVEQAPFGDLANDRLVKLYVAFVTQKPRRAPAFPLRLPKEALEATGAIDGDVLIVSRRKPNGLYGFPANWIEDALGVASTARNWSTVRRIVESEARR